MHFSVLQQQQHSLFTQHLATQQLNPANARPMRSRQTSPAAVSSTTCSTPAASAAGSSTPRRPVQMIVRTPLSAAVTARWSPATQQRHVWATLWFGPVYEHVNADVRRSTASQGRNTFSNSRSSHNQKYDRPAAAWVLRMGELPVLLQNTNINLAILPSRVQETNKHAHAAVAKPQLPAVAGTTPAVADPG